MVESSNVSCQDVGLDEKSSLNTDSICEGRDAGDNGSDLAVDMKTTGSCQVKVGGPNVELALKGIQGHTVSEGDLVAQGSRNALRDEKGVGVLISAGLQHSSDEIMEDSLSEVFQKAQSNFVGKSCNTLSSKQNCGSQNLKDGLSLDPKSATQTAEGICDSNISDGLLVDPCFSVNGCYGDSQQLSCVQSEDFCSPSDQKAALQEIILNDSLKECSAILHDVEKIIDTVSLSKMGEGVPQFSEGELKSRLTDEQAQVCNSTSKYGDFTSMEKEKLFPCDSEPLTKSSENILNENSQMVSGSVNFETKFVSGRSCCDHNSLDTKAEVQDFVLGFLPENNCAVSGGCLYPVVSNEANKSELAAQPNHLEIPLEVHNIPKDTIAFIPECSSVLDPTQPSQNTFEEGSLPNDDCFYAKKETDDASPQSGIPEENENYVEYAASVSEVANIDKTSSVMRRKAKKRRHGDMAYEGDADWDVLINDQVFLESQGGVDGERILRSRAKLDSSLNVVEESESVAVAVSAGLKAHEAGPVEKIRFKEILKRKGGLQEYLDCRSVDNLSKWSLHLLAIGLSKCSGRLQFFLCNRKVTFSVFWFLWCLVLQLLITVLHPL